MSGNAHYYSKVRRKETGLNRKNIQLALYISLHYYGIVVSIAILYGRWAV